MSASETSRQPRVYLLRGDLQTMASMARSARALGLSVGQKDVYPTLDEEDFKKFLKHLWELPSSWCYTFRSEMIQLGICNEAEFSAKFNPRK